MWLWCGYAFPKRNAASAQYSPPPPPPPRANDDDDCTQQRSNNARRTTSANAARRTQQQQQHTTHNERHGNNAEATRTMAHNDAVTRVRTTTRNDIRTTHGDVGRGRGGW